MSVNFERSILSLLLMRLQKIIALLLSISILTPLCAVGQVVHNDEFLHTPEHRPGEVLVQLKDDTQPMTLHFENDAAVIEIANEYQKNPNVAYAEPNYVYHLAAFDPNDIYYPEQWYLRQIGMPFAWEQTTGGPDVVVAVIDSGVDINHPDLRDNIWRNPAEVAGDGIDNDGNGFTDDTHGWDFIENTNDPRPDATPPYSRTALHHGTVVAGVIGAVGNNVTGVAGISWRTKIMPLRVLDGQGQGDVNQVSDAIEYATANGATIINLSFVGEGFSQRLESALARAAASGVIIVVAAGNSVDAAGHDLDSTPLYPVCYDMTASENWIIGVTAMDHIDQRAPHANYGARCVDVAAPGYNFYSTQVFDDRRGLTEAYGGGWSGTSLATPVVAGVAALVKGLNRSLTAVQVSEILTKTADDVYGVNQRLRGKLGRGRVNAAQAVLGASHPNGTVPIQDVYDSGRILTIPAERAITDVKSFSARGELKRTWRALEAALRSGGTVAVSEDSRPEPPAATDKVRLSIVIRGEQRIVVGEGPTGTGRIRVLSTNGEKLAEWLAFGRPFRGGVTVASGDVFGDGSGSVVAVPTSNGGPQVRIFNPDGKLRGQFFAYDKNMNGGLSVAVADLDGDGTSEIIVSSTTRELPVRIFQADGKLQAQWDPYPNFRGGVTVAAGDIDGDGIASVVAAPIGGGPQIRVFNKGGSVELQFFAFHQRSRARLSVAVGDVDGDNIDDIVATLAGNPGDEVRLFNQRGVQIRSFFAYGRRFVGGLRLAILR